MREVSAQRGTTAPAIEIPTALALSSKVIIVGSVQYNGPIQLDGVVQGEVRCDELTVSRQSTVEGVIVADTVTVLGRVNGSIYANKLVLKSACDVEGEIYHRELALEDGSYFEGKSRPHQTPLELASGKEEAKAPPQLAAAWQQSRA
jgi:cytoskeletal protein CcmA (bactofilin family)